MTKRSKGTRTNRPDLEDDNSISRRDFFKAGAAGAAVGVATAASLATTPAAAQSADEIEWDYEFDVVVCGGGCMGLPSAIRATDLGASTILLDQNFDLGGRYLHSAGLISLGGGDPLQLRDIAGEGDPEGFITVDPIHAVEELDEDTDHLFRDMTDWSIVDGAAQSPYRYNERELHRAWADNCFDTRNFLMENYVRMGRISGTHGTGGMTRARRAVGFLMLGEETNIPAGTITPEDAGWADMLAENRIEATSHFAPTRIGSSASVVGPGAVGAGSCSARALEYSAREKGVQVMVNRHMDELIQDDDGRVIGVKASYTPRFDPETGERLESYWSNGNIDETKDVIYIRANKGVIIGTGGHPGNPQVRSMFYPAFRDPVWGSSGQALLGRERGADGSGITAGLKIGANLAGMQQNLSYSTTYHVSTRVATPDAYTDMYPGHPTFPFRGSTGFTMNANDFEHAIAVNQVGRRFYNDMDGRRRHSSANFPGGSIYGDGGGVNLVQGDWRNCSRDFIRGMYQRYAGMDAALAINEGSEAPDFHPGPLWAIFDSAGAERMELELRFPFISDNGYFFQADTIEDLADAIYAEHEYQRVPLTYLRETVDRWNGFADAGEDPDFGRGPDAPLHRIDTGPFYAAAIVIVWHDSYGGLRINGKCQVMDMTGQPIPGLYAGAEASGGGNQHGLGRGLVHGYIAGTNIANE